MGPQNYQQDRLHNDGLKLTLQTYCGPLPFSLHKSYCEQLFSSTTRF